jgi:hypothetical protein
MSRVAPQFIDDSIIGRVQWRGNLGSSARLVSIMRREENVLAGSSCDWRSLVLRRGSQRERQSPEYQSGNLISSGLSFNFSALSRPNWCRAPPEIHHLHAAACARKFLASWEISEMEIRSQRGRSLTAGERARAGVVTQINKLSQRSSIFN